MNKLVAKFQKNAVEEVRIELTEFKSRQLVNLRVYYLDENGMRKPSSKGLTLPVALLPDLAQGVNALRVAAVAGGLLEPEEFQAGSKVGGSE